MSKIVKSVDQKSSYRSIFKATSLFGGVQMYQILIQIIKSKYVAVLLGPEGFGIMGLYQSALDLVKQVTSLGISQSAVRDVSEANSTGDLQKISRTIVVLRKIVWWTGMLGLLSVAALSPILSMTSFGNYDYTIPFLLLSIILLLEQLSAGQRVVLQGMRRLRDLAKCSSIGVTLGMLFSIPLYYLLRIDGIIPTMILNAVTSVVVSWAYARKVRLEPISTSFKETINESKNMINMGLSMSISGVLAVGIAFVLRSYIRRIGGTEEVGLYQAGFAIIESYVGLVFSAISTDYYPRLASVNTDNEKCKEIICQQGEIGVFILAPMLTLCIVFMPLVLRVLYSDAFVAANNFILWCCLGMMFRLASWVISYLFIAKSESKLFVISETLGKAYFLLFNILGYKLGGLNGLGIAFILQYAIFFVQVYLIAYIRYQFSLSISFIKPFAIQMFLVALCLIVVFLTKGWIRFIMGVFVILTSVTFALVGLNNRTNFREMLQFMKVNRN